MSFRSSFRQRREKVRADYLRSLVENPPATEWERSERYLKAEMERLQPQKRV